MWHCVYSFLKAVVGEVIHPGSLFDTCYVHYCCESLYFVSIKLIISVAVIRVVPLRAAL